MSCRYPGYMEAVSFTSRRFQIADGPAGTRDVVLSTIVSAADARALGSALSWQRQADYLAPATESADQVLALRALVLLVDQFEALQSGGGPVMLREDQVLLLAEASHRYVAARDVDGHQPPQERERIARLKSLGGPLFDLVADFAGAQAEAAEQHLR